MKDSRQHEVLFLLWLMFATLPPTSTFIVIAGGIISGYHLIASLYYTYKESKEKGQ